MIPLLLATLCTLPQEAGVIVRDEVALCELNHYFDEYGKPTFDQAIFYDWDNSEGRYVCRAWRMIKCPSQLPVLAGESYRCLWLDGEALREVRCEQVRETHTQYDPELLERATLPQSQRRGLTYAPQERRQ
jgi:hypothetical protein